MTHQNAFLFLVSFPKTVIQDSLKSLFFLWNKPWDWSQSHTQENTSSVKAANRRIQVWYQACFYCPKHLMFSLEINASQKRKQKNGTIPKITLLCFWHANMFWSTSNHKEKSLKTWTVPVHLQHFCALQATRSRYVVCPCPSKSGWKMRSVHVEQEEEQVPLVSWGTNVMLSHCHKSICGRNSFWLVTYACNFPGVLSPITWKVQLNFLR